MNLIPQTPGTTPGYYCTWEAQNALFAKEKAMGTNPEKFAGPGGAQIARHNMNEEIIFGKNGMARQFEKIRRDLYFVLDDGWDVPYNVHPDTQRHAFGSLLLEEERFPSCIGTPEERLGKINDKIKAMGWRGVGLWIASQAQGETDENRLGDADSRDYWAERMAWCRYAGVDYWKVDWGVYERCKAWRKMLTELGRKEHPGLLIEHAACRGPINENNGRFAGWSPAQDEFLSIMDFSDIFRSYDVVLQFTTVSTLDRLAVLLSSPVSADAMGLVNCEDELYMGAALGCPVGIMRTALDEVIPRKLDEAIRAVMWQRLAPAYGVSEAQTYISEELGCDTWFFTPGSTWCNPLIGHEIMQSAPLIVSRGMDLPRVDAAGDKAPYVVASRNPNGAVTVAALPRCFKDRKVTPLTKVGIDVHSTRVPIGILGEFDELQLNFAQYAEGKRVYAQDLAGDVAHEITGQVKINGMELLIPGGLITSIGLEAATPSDTSSPGMVLVLA